LIIVFNFNGKVVEMIVCLCAGVDDCEVQRCIEGGARSLTELARRCGAGGDCGGCHDMLRESLAAADEADADVSKAA
jgi:bacterioferritin-associated ferredoxin